MSKLFKRFGIGILCAVMLMSFAMFALMQAGKVKAETIPKTGFENLCVNGDFETEYSAWGVNGLSPERIFDEETESFIGKVTQPGWVQARIWNASFMIGAEFRITFKIKPEKSEGDITEGETPEGETPEGETPEGETPEGETPEGETPEGETPGGETPEGETPGGETPEGETPDAEITKEKNDNQFLIRMGGYDSNNSVFVGPEAYLTGWGEGGLLTVGEWTEITVYFAIVDNHDGTYTLNCGTDRTNYQLQHVTNSNIELNYFDLAIGCGSMGTLTEYYLDNISVTKCGITGDSVWENSDFELEFPETGWGVNNGVCDRLQDEEADSFVIRRTGGGWLNNRLWSAQIEAGKLYRFSVDLKVESPLATTDGQFLTMLKWNDDNAQMGYVEIGCNGGVATNVYRQYIWYIKFVEDEEGNLVLHTGKSKDALTPNRTADNQGFLQSAADQVSHLDVSFGTGNPGSATAWYVDNFACVDVTPLVMTDATLKVVYEDGTPAEEFTYTVNGEYKEISAENNIVSVTGILGTATYTVTKQGYYSVSGVLAEGENEVVLRERVIEPDTTRPEGNLYPFYNFEDQEISATMESIMNFGNGWELFVNGTQGQVGLQITDENSYLGEKSLKVTNGSDRFVTRIIAETTQYHYINANVRYHAVYYMRGDSPGITVQPCVVVSVYTSDSDYWDKGWGPNANSNCIDLGVEITLSDTEWTRIDVNFSYRFEGNKLIVSGDAGDTEYEFANDITHVGLFDLSFKGAGTFYTDNVALFESYDATVAVYGADNELQTEGVTYTFTDYMGQVHEFEGKYENGVYVVENLFGNFSVSAALSEERVFEGTVSERYRSLILAEPYSPKIIVCYPDGTLVAREKILEVFAMDGANEVAGVFDEETNYWVFENVMGELDVFVWVKGAEQHKIVQITRTMQDVEISVLSVPDASLGLAGNMAGNGNAEEGNNVVMLSNTEYAYPNTTTIPAEGKWFSFGPVISLSDEAAVGEKSVRLTIDTERLAADDPVYKQHMEDNGLAHKKFGDRGCYRAGNAFLYDGTEYSYVSYVKAPQSEQSVTFQLIYLVGCSLNNGGQFNLWVPTSVTVGNRFWEKFEMRFSFTLEEDEAANATGNYNEDRWQLVFRYELFRNDESIVKNEGTYGYELYSKGQYYFYGFTPQGEMYGFNGITEFEDTTHNGGASFGSFGSIEPSYQITSGSSLLIDGATLTSGYDAEIRVLDRELKPNTDISWLKLIDDYTGEILWFAAADCYDVEAGVYRIADLFHSYRVYACDGNKQPIDGLVGQSISSERTNAVVEFEYTMKLTVRDQHGNAVKDLNVRISLANGSTVNATNNGDGTYSYAGLTGVRAISFRKAQGSENSYTFPSGLTVTSADCEKTITVTLNAGDDSVKPEPPVDNTGKGCGGYVAAGSVMVASALMSGAVSLILKRKKN